MEKCIICSRNAERHHIKTRKSGGSDESHNIMHLCRQHHVEIHYIGRTSFAKKYRAARLFLINNGWEFCEFNKKWWHPEEI